MEEVRSGKDVIVQKVSPTDTLRNMPLGTPYKFKCTELGSFAGVGGIISRINKEKGQTAYVINTVDCGATYVITRLL